MLGEFAAIVEEIVRGAEELRKALVRSRTDLAATATAFQQAVATTPVSSVPRSTSQVAAEAVAAAPIPPAPRPTPQIAAEAVATTPVSPVPRSTSQIAAEAVAAVPIPPAPRPTPQVAAEAVARVPPSPQVSSDAAGERRVPRGTPVLPTAVLSLDRLQGATAREISQMLDKAQSSLSAVKPGVSGEAVARESRQLSNQLQRVRPSVEEIARRLREGVGRAKEKPGRQQWGPARSPLQRLFRTPRWQRMIRRWEVSPSPLRRYVGQALGHYARWGHARHFFRTLARAPQAMRTPQAIAAATQAGIGAARLAAGAQAVGLVGRIGGAVATAAGAAAGPAGLVIIGAVALGTAFVKLAQTTWNLMRAKEQAVFKTREYAESLAHVHAGMAGLAAQQQMRELQEKQRTAARTYGTTRLAMEVEQRYRREGEELRILGENVGNLMKVVKVYAFKAIEYWTPIGWIYLLLKQLAGPINEFINQWLGNKGTPQAWTKWLEPYQSPIAPLKPRTPPQEPFNRGPKKK